MGFEYITGPNFVNPTTTNAINTAIGGLQGYLFGLTLSTAGSSSTFSISSGKATDSTGVALMVLASAYTKTTSAWAVGSGNGALDTGAIATSTWYHVFLIDRTDIGITDILFSLSATAPTMPANYTLFRRIGSMKTDGSSQWVKFIQLGDEFLWVTPINDVNIATLGTVATLFTLSVPINIQVNALFRGYIISGTLHILVLINSPDEAVAASNAPQGNITTTDAVATTTVAPFTLNLRTNTSAQIRAVSDTASTSLVIATYGWIDTRGRNN